MNNEQLTVNSENKLRVKRLLVWEFDNRNPLRILPSPANVR